MHFVVIWRVAQHSSFRKEVFWGTGGEKELIKRIAAEESLDMLGHGRKKEVQLPVKMKICIGGKCVYTKRKPLHQMWASSYKCSSSLHTKQEGRTCRPQFLAQQNWWLISRTGLYFQEILFHTLPLLWNAPCYVIPHIANHHNHNMQFFLLLLTPVCVSIRPCPRPHPPFLEKFEGDTKQVKFDCKLWNQGLLV